MRPWAQSDVWETVAGELRGLRQQGLSRLLTEETVRFATVKALVRAGVEPVLLRYESPHPALPNSRIDLVVGSPPQALIELKYPREPNVKNAAWTMIYGEILKDFYRLAAYPDPSDRIFVYAQSDRLHKYMTGAMAKHGLDIDQDDVILHPEQAALVPATIATVLGPTLATKTVTAHRITAIEVDAALELFVYTVDPIAAIEPGIPMTTIEPDENIVRLNQDHGRSTRARGEILAAIEAIVTRSGAPTFELNDVLVEMHRRGSTYAESTVRTMVTSHMCANAPDHLAKTFEDLERVARGLYRRRLPAE